MFTVDSIIDAVQNTKKQFVTTVFASNEPFKTELVKLVDAQTEFAKGQFKTSLQIAESFYKNATNAIYAKTK